MLTSKEEQGIHRYAAALPDIYLAGGHHLCEDEPTRVKAPAVEVDAARVYEHATCIRMIMLVGQPARVVHSLGGGLKQLFWAKYARLWGAASNQAALLQHNNIWCTAEPACTKGPVSGTQHRAAPTFVPIKDFEL